MRVVGHLGWRPLIKLKVFVCLFVAGRDEEMLLILLFNCVPEVQCITQLAATKESRLFSLDAASSLNPRRPHPRGPQLTGAKTHQPNKHTAHAARSENIIRTKAPKDKFAFS